MRMISFVAGLALVAAACGGEKAAQQPAQQAAAQPAMAADSQAMAAPAGTGTVHEVKMLVDASGKYHFEPAALTIKTGDTVRWIDVSGGPHNVAFWADSIPAGANAVLAKNMPSQDMGPLSGKLLVAPEATYEVSFAGAPAGLYKYYCVPHLALGMKATLTVTP